MMQCIVLALAAGPARCIAFLLNRESGALRRACGGGTDHRWPCINDRNAHWLFKKAGEQPVAQDAGASGKPDSRAEADYICADDAHSAGRSKQSAGRRSAPRELWQSR